MTSLNIKDLEISAVASSLAAGCRPCTLYHIRQAKAAGASSREIDEVLEISYDLSVGYRKSIVLAVSSDSAEPSNFVIDENLTDNQLLSAIGAAYAMNNADLLAKLITKVKEKNIPKGAIAEVVGLAAQIKFKAGSHLRPALDRHKIDEKANDAIAHLCT